MCIIFAQRIWAALKLLSQIKPVKWTYILDHKTKIQPTKSPSLQTAPIENGKQSTSKTSNRLNGYLWKVDTFAYRNIALALWKCNGVNERNSLINAIKIAINYCSGLLRAWIRMATQQLKIINWWCYPHMYRILYWCTGWCLLLQILCGM